MRSTPEKTFVTSSTTPNNERLIPIVVQKQNGETKPASLSPLKAVTSRTPRSPVKPALPAKPLSPTRPSRVTVPVTSSPIADSSDNKSSEAERVITVTVEKLEDLSIPEKVMIEEIVTPDEVITQNGTSHSPEEEEEKEMSVAQKNEAVKENDIEERHTEEPASRHSHRHHEYDEEEDPFQAERYLRSSTSPPCGIRERSLLCPIQEEDTESTASGSSVSVNNRFATVSANASKEQTPMSTTSIEESAAQDRSVVIVDEYVVVAKAEAEHDGHYFIKVRASFPAI